MPPFDLELAVAVASEVAVEEEEEVEVAVAELDAVPVAINQACWSKPLLLAVAVPVESGHPPSHLATALAELARYKTVDDWLSAEVSSSP